MTWYIYAVSVTVALYWMSNAIIWIPWTYSPTAGMIVMLTVAPVLWFVGVRRILSKRAALTPWRKTIGSILVLLVVSIVSDLVFFGWIRHAMDQLLHPTTYAGYGILVLIPLVHHIYFRDVYARNDPIPDREFAVVTGVAIVAFLTVWFFIRHG